MRTNLLRAVLAVVVLVTCAAPALAQSVVRGKALDNTGKPVPDAVVLFERQDQNQKAQGKTDRNGEFIQVGLASGEWKVTISKDKVGTATMTIPVKQGNNPVMTLNLVPAAAAGSAAAGLGATKDKEEAAALQALAAGALAAFKAGDNDTAITRFNEVIVKVPTCSDCYYNLALAHVNKKDYAQAEIAFKKVVELKPDSAEAYTGLANIYNTQKKFDLAAEASANAAKYSGGAAGGGGSAEALYNNGVILFNAQKFPEAKAQFEAAVKTDPNMAMAQYQLGMTALNLGDFALAVTSLETYLKLDPNGAKAAEVKASLPALQSMVKK
jgi:tetratricopeptide (TPR) repeat protein